MRLRDAEVERLVGRSGAGGEIEPRGGVVVVVVVVVVDGGSSSTSSRPRVGE